MANADTLNDLKSLARFMRGVQDVVVLLETAGGLDQVVAEAEARVRDVNERESQARAELARVLAKTLEAQTALDDLTGQKPAYLEKIRAEAEAIVATAKADAARILEQGERQVAELVDEARRDRQRLIDENIVRLKNGAKIEAENNGKLEELARINAQLDAARKAIAALMPSIVDAPAAAPQAEPAPAS